MRKHALAVAIVFAVLAAHARAQVQDGSQPSLGGAPQMQSAQDAYWDAVRRMSGPVGFPRATPDDPHTRVIRPRVLGASSFPLATYVAPPPPPVYVPVFIPVPIVYVPAPVPPPSASDERPAAPAAPRHPEKFYVIPGCYGGNRPPDPDALPAGCDIKKLRIATW
jgi:hypothetical protein